ALNRFKLAANRRTSAGSTIACDMELSPARRRDVMEEIGTTRGLYRGRPEGVGEIWAMALSMSEFLASGGVYPRRRGESHDDGGDKPRRSPRTRSLIFGHCGFTNHGFAVGSDLKNASNFSATFFWPDAEGCVPSF